MRKLNKNERIIRWASNKKTRNIKHAMKELNYEDRKTFMYKLNRLRRHGLINFSVNGESVTLNLTQIAYYNRAVLVA